MVLGMCALLATVSVTDAAQARKSSKKPKKTVTRKASAAKPSGAETGLIGIKLYDTGMKVIATYGNPDDVQAVSTSGVAVGGGGGGGAAPASAPGRQSQGLGDTQAPIDFNAPFGLGDDTLNVRQSGLAPAIAPPDASAGGRSTAAPGGGRSTGGRGGFNPGNGGRGGAAAPGGGGGSGERINYTRWIYNRGGSKYGFILDHFNHVVQIEAIGIQNQKVKTRAGVGFGSTFASIIRAYGAPDGYEINGNNLIVRYLVKRKVAFRLNRLGMDKPHVVTAVVVSAGKA